VAGFASSPNGWIVKTINVEVAGTLPTETTAVTTAPPPPIPTYVPPPQPSASGEAAERARYGMDLRYSQPNRGYGEGGAKFQSPYPQPYAAQPAPVTAPKGGGGLPVVLDEKQLKVTLQLVAVKLMNTNLVAAR